RLRGDNATTTEARATLRELAATLGLAIRQGGIAETPANDGEQPPEQRPLYVRAIDAFEVFYRQLATVSQRMAELRATFEASPLSAVVFAAADLNCAWGVLNARLEMLAAVTNDEAGQQLWTLPAMQLLRDRLRSLLHDGAAYLSRHLDDGWP